MSSCVRAQGDGATGVKQLSALAAAGEKMLLNQKGSPNSLVSAGQAKAWKSKVKASGNRRYLFGCQGSTGEPWVWENKASQNISPSTEKSFLKNSTHRLSRRNAHHTRSLTHHTCHNTPVYPDSSQCSHYVLLCSYVRGRLLQKKIFRGGKKGMTTFGPQLRVCFCFNDIVVFFFCFFSSCAYYTGCHWSCTCATSASELVTTTRLTGLFVFKFER